MNAHAPNPRFLSDDQLIAAVREKAARAEAEIEAAFRSLEGTEVREWHLERADQATVELLGLINGQQYQDVWQRFAEFAAPLTRECVPSFLRTAPMEAAE
ncbi:MAG: hypothetical protein HC783_13290 [Rhodobacteraceae bacterium]|nr:hypothetical protein [Paracoccaceae bacterium]